MILLLFDPRLDEAGVKRLQPTWRRIRRHEQRSGAFASIDKQNRSLGFASTALPLLKSRRLHNTGLKSKRMDNRGKLNSHLRVAPQRDKYVFSEAKAVPQMLSRKQRSRVAFFLKRSEERRV